jgi:hypothetical protein
MATVVFLCPNFADDGTADNGHSYDESVACLACQQLHFLNKASGKCWGLPTISGWVICRRGCLGFFQVVYGRDLHPQ